MATVKARVEPGLGSRLNDEGPQGPVLAAIRLNDGRTYEKLIAKCKGDPSKPMSFDEVAEEKFRKYLPISIGPIPRERAEAIVESVRGIAALRDVGEIGQRLGTLVGTHE